MNFKSDLGALAADLIETRGWSRQDVITKIGEKVGKLRQIARDYGDGSKIRGGAGYLEHLYGGNPREDHFDDLIIDAIRCNVPWGNMVADLMSLDIIISTGGRGR